MHYSIILNQTANGGKAQKAWQMVQAKLIQNQIDFDVQITKDQSSAEYMARRVVHQRSATNTVIIAMGGDGTLHQVLNGAIKASKQSHQPCFPLAYIPAGINNDFARAYGISLEPTHALQQILTADQKEPINIGHYYEAIKGEDGYFLNNIGIGFDAAILSRTNNGKPKQRAYAFRLSHLAYLKQAIGVLYDQQPFQLMVQEGLHRYLYPKAYIVLLVNHPYIGGGVKVAPGTNIHQPQLDLLVAERRSWPITFCQLMQFSRGKLMHSRLADHLTAKRFHYTTTSLEFGQSDGEPMGNRFIDITTDIIQYPFWQNSEN